MDLVDDLLDSAGKGVVGATRDDGSSPAHIDKSDMVEVVVSGSNSSARTHMAVICHAHAEEEQKEDEDGTKHPGMLRIGSLIEFLCEVQNARQVV